MSLGGFLEEHRILKNISREKLAEQIGVSARTIFGLESGEGRLTNLLSAYAGIGASLSIAGSHLKQHRLKQRLTIRQLAELAGVAPNTILAIEQGKDILVASFERVAEALQVKLKPTISKDDTTWTTPTCLAQKLCEAVGGEFDIDVASPGASLSPIKAKQHFTIRENGLLQSWHGKVWMNPPYGQRELKFWVQKAAMEAASGRVEVLIALIPASFDTGWWEEHVASQADVYFLRGRLIFGGSVNVAPFRCALLVYWQGEPDIEIRGGIESAIEFTQKIHA